MSDPLVCLNAFPLRRTYHNKMPESLLNSLNY